MAEAITDAAGTGGTIYVESGTFDGFTLTGFHGSDLVIEGGTGGGTTIFDSQIYLHHNDASIFLRNFTAHGADADAGVNTLGTAGTSGDNTPTILALNNSGTITLEHLVVSHESDTPIHIDDHSGAVLLDDVNASNSGNGADINNTAGDKNVIVTNSIFNNNADTGLKVVSNGSIGLNYVIANDNANIGAYLETSGDVIVMNSQFMDTPACQDECVAEGCTEYNNTCTEWGICWFLIFPYPCCKNWEQGGCKSTGCIDWEEECDEGNHSQNIGLSINNTNTEAFETSLCNVTAKNNDEAQIVLTAPTGEEGSNFVYNLCDIDAGDSCGDEIFFYGGLQWTIVSDPACPFGQQRGTGEDADKCFRYINGKWEYTVRAQPPCPYGQSLRNGVCKEYHHEQWDYKGIASYQYKCPSGQTKIGSKCYQWRCGWFGCYWKKKGYAEKVYDDCGQGWTRSGSKSYEVTPAYWETIGDPQPKCPEGQETGHPRSSKCYEWHDGYWDERGDVLTEPTSNITVNTWNVTGDIFSDTLLNLIPCTGEGEHGHCGCPCGGDEEECELCEEVCELPLECGDGFVTEGEQCDDGNTSDGDGCSSDCTSEPMNCEGSWGDCVGECGTGTQTYTITRSAAYGGTECAYSHGETRSCDLDPCPIDCVGDWGDCVGECGTGTQTYTVTTPAQYGGAECKYEDGEQQACDLDPCPIDCNGAWVRAKDHVAQAFRRTR